jgi:hypothetical protein
MRRTTVLLSLLLALSATAAPNSEALLAKAWPATSGPLNELGTGIGLVFSPDLSVPGNCSFYRALGFACFESADWLQVLADVHAWNLDHPGRRIRTLILETHGTNGNGLKIQKGKKPEDDRSYVSVAALQETLEPAGVRTIVLSACNSGRLLRPAIYRKLNRNPGDKLFLPPTLGVLDATDSFDPKRNSVTVLTPGASHIENTLVGSLRELTPATRVAIEEAAKTSGITLPDQFAVSEILIRMLTRDPELELRTGEHVDALSKEQTSQDTSEQLFQTLVAELDRIATRSTTGTQIRASK